MEKMSSFYGFTYQDLNEHLLAQGFSQSTASHLFNWHYKKKQNTPCELRISFKAKEYVYSIFDFTLPEITQAQQAKDRTVKFLINFDSDNPQSNSVEAVLIPFQGKYTLCVSSQVGCAMNCSFCFTGTQGLKRSLKTEEIIGQYLKAQEWLITHRPDDTWISNIVFMGQGEPLHNFECVQKACLIFTSQHGLSIGPQKITVSTSGFTPGLLKWLAQPLGVNLALSLHSTRTEIRNELIPINKKYPLSDVLKIIDQIPLQNKQFVTYEYLLVNELNDSMDDAHQLGELLKSKRALINLIPFNPFPGSKYKRPKREKIESFKNILNGYKVPTMIRTTKGDQVLAACGQLNTKNT